MIECLLLQSKLHARLSGRKRVVEAEPSHKEEVKAGRKQAFKEKRQATQEKVQKRLSRAKYKARQACLSCLFVCFDRRDVMTILG